jgi:predicted PurR-regulated permease PerM
MMENGTRNENTQFLAYFTLALLAASLWIFRSYLHYLLVAAVLALATSHVFNALVGFIDSAALPKKVKGARRGIAAGLLTLFFLMMIFLPLLYFVSVTIEQVSGLDLEQMKNTAIEMVNKAVAFLDRFEWLKKPLERLKTEGLEFLKGPAVDAAVNGATGLVTSAGALFGQIIWILLFYFLFNAYGHQILRFTSNLMPMSYEHETYLYHECTGTVAVVFYGTLFNMAAQGLAFGILMAFIGGYNAFYLGVLTGFCSVVPIIGAALVYVPIIALELFAGNFVSAVVIFAFAWVVMGFLIDNILRLVFIGFLKKMFGFQYKMNEILILLAIMAGITSFGFWGLIIGPMVLALTLAAANLFSSHNEKTQALAPNRSEASETDEIPSDEAPGP